MRRAAAFVLTVGLAIAAPAGAGDNSTIMFGKWPEFADCNRSNAQKVELKALLADFSAYHDLCVTTVGFAEGDALFADPEDVKLPHAPSNKKSAGRRLGVYGSDDSLKAWRVRLGGMVRVTGRAWSCRDLSDKNTIMVMGYCHSADGPIIGVTTVEDAAQKDKSNG